MRRDIETSTHGARRSAPQSSRSSWRRWALGLLAAVVAGGFIDARAEACGFPAGALPPGSYALSCTNCTVQGTTLTCDCLRINQTFNQTSLDIADCRTDPANTDGVLVCDRCDEECEVDLLTWVGGRAGAFSNPDNWEPPRVPTAEDGRHCDTVVVRGGGDVVIDVDAPAPAPGAAAVAPAPIRRIGRLEVDQCRSLSPVDGTIKVDALSPVVGERSLELRNGATLQLDAGAVLARHVAVGALGEGTIEVVGTGGLLDTEGRLGLGLQGSGNLVISDGATVIAAEAVLGETSAQGSATLQGAASTLDTGSLAVGLEDDGALVIEGGAKVTSDTSVVDFDLSGDSRGRATVRGKDAAGNPSKWTSDSLDVGPRGSVLVDEGGSVEVSGLLRLGFEGADASCLVGLACLSVVDGQVQAVGGLVVGDSGDAEVEIGPKGVLAAGGESALGGEGTRGSLRLLGPSESESVLTDLVVGIAENSFGALRLEEGAQLELLGRFRVGGPDGSVGRLSLFGDPASPDATRLEVFEGDAFDSLVGDGTDAPAGAVVPETGILVIHRARLELEGGQHGLVIQRDGALSADDGTVAVEGSGQVVNRGLIEGNLVIEGDFVQEATGVVRGFVLSSPGPAVGPARDLALAAAAPPPPYQPLVVTGDATLAGKAVLQFGNGVAPQQGDPLALLEVQGDVTGAFDEIEVKGLAPGADFASQIVNGAIVLTSLTNAEPLPHVNLSAKPLLLESKKAAKVKLTRTGDTSVPLTVAYTVGGTAESGADYVALPGAIEFPARRKSVTLLVQPIADGVAEGVETIEIALAPDESFAPGLASTLTLELRDGK
jgi:T5SS/PEP-CTERM-associated repeat protein